MNTQIIKEQQSIDGWVVRTPNKDLKESFYRHLIGWYREIDLKIGDQIMLKNYDESIKFKVINITAECNHTTDSFISDNIMFIPHVIIMRIE